MAKLAPTDRCLICRKAAWIAGHGKCVAHMGPWQPVRSQYAMYEAAWTTTGHGKCSDLILDSVAHILGHGNRWDSSIRGSRPDRAGYGNAAINHLINVGMQTAWINRVW